MKLPPKTPGEHRWIAIATYSLTVGQAAAAHSGSEIKLGPHNLVSTMVGCVDCERQWPTHPKCPASAASEMQDVTAEFADAELSPEDEDRIIAAVDVIQRTGAKGFEVGHLEDGVPIHLARWYAHASYKGTRISVDEFPNPIDATEALVWKLLAGGGCLRCGRVIHVAGHAGQTDGRCIWRREGRKWMPGCVEDDEPVGTS